MCGAEGDLFASGAIDVLSRASSGVIGEALSLASLALAAAYQARASVVHNGAPEQL